MNKNSKKTVEPKSGGMGFGTKNKKATKKVETSKEKLTRKQIIILVSILLVAVLISAAIITTVVLVKKFNDPDLMTAKLSKYISISEEDYKGFDLNIPLDEYTESGVDRNINLLLTEHKTLNRFYNGRYDASNAITLGDRVLIYYRGYTVDQSGKKVDIEGACNFNNDPTWLEAGTGKILTINDDQTESASGYFIPGFGEGLVGLIPQNFSKLIYSSASTEGESENSGRIMAGDIIFLTYTVNGNTVENEKIDLSRTDLDAVYGNGFKELFIGTEKDGKLEGFKLVGEKVNSFKTAKSGSDAEIEYKNLTVSYLIRGGEENTHTVSLKFPASYNDESLRGTDACFDIYVVQAMVFDVPEFNDEFVTETLKVKESDLSSYSGETVSEKYRAKIAEEHRIEIEESNHDLLVTKMWNHLMDKVEIKKLPKKIVEPYITQYNKEISTMYESYKSQYSSKDALAIDYLNNVYGAGLSSGSDWKSYVEALANRDATQKILFYYIIRRENLLPTDAEYQAAYDHIYSQVWDYYQDLHAEELMLLEGEEYNNRLAELKRKMNEYYGEDYFKEQAYYYYGTRKMLTLGKRA
ncbi:MAG: hypothetical protein IKV16_05370 [Clostridia bacterium]|nr:hypothetical protein [Clostridia bacterium]